MSSEASLCLALLVVMQAHDMALAVTQLTLQLLKAGIFTEGDFLWCLRALLAHASSLRLFAAAKLLYITRHLPIKNMAPFYRRLAQYCTHGFPGMDATLASRIKVISMC